MPITKIHFATPAKLSPAVVAHHETGGLFCDGPRRREAALSGSQNIRSS
jgi:hypothetical protein